MIEPQAMKMALELAGAYPGRGVDDTTIALWASAFIPETQDVAVRAIGRLVLAFPDRPPTMGQVFEELRIAKPHAAPALPPPEHQSRYLTEAELRHGFFHLRRFFDARREDDREAMKRPWECACTEWVDNPIPHPAKCSCQKGAHV